MDQTGVIKSPLFLLLEVLNIFGCNRKPYAGSLEGPSDAVYVRRHGVILI